MAMRRPRHYRALATLDGFGELFISDLPALHPRSADREPGSLGDILFFVEFDLLP